MSRKSDGGSAAQEPVESMPALAARWPRLVGVSDDAMERIRALRIVCVSAGSVASRIAVHCARMEVAAMLVVDPARLKRESLLTHDILPESIGRAKAEYVAEVCRQISPATQVRALVCKLQDLPASTCADYDFIFAATDNLNAETATAQLALHLGIPLLLAAVHGETLTAQVKLFANAPTGGPCPVCLFNDRERSLQDEEAVFSCAGGPTEFRTGPTRSTSFLCSMAADLAVAQGVRWFLGLGAGVGDTELTWSAYSHRVLQSPLVANANCPLEHAAWQQRRGVATDRRDHDRRTAFCRTHVPRTRSNGFGGGLRAGGESNLLRPSARDRPFRSQREHSGGVVSGLRQRAGGAAVLSPPSSAAGAFAAASAAGRTRRGRRQRRSRERRNADGAAARREASGAKGRDGDVNPILLRRSSVD